MQPDPAASPLFDFIGPLIEDVVRVRDPMVALDARRVLAEMDCGDGLSVLAMDALMLGMLVHVSRGGHAERARRTPPPWLKRIREILDEGFRQPPSLNILAVEAGVTPTHLCHAFRAHVGTTHRPIRAIRAGIVGGRAAQEFRPASLRDRGGGWVIRTRVISSGSVVACWARAPRITGEAAAGTRSVPSHARGRYLIACLAARIHVPR
jgi:AraC-like DNA-binding protein